MKNIIILLVILGVVAGVAVGVTRQDEVVAPQPSSRPVSVIESVGKAEEKVGQGSYVDYSEAALASASKDGRAVLFFKANWCSTCSVLDEELINETGELPEDVTVLKVNYDKAKDLKKQHNVTVQHTLVQVDEDGRELKKWVGGGVDAILEQLI